MLRGAVGVDLSSPFSLPSLPEMAKVYVNLYKNNNTLTGYGELPYKEIHPGFPAFAHQQGNKDCGVSQDYHREQDPQHGKLFRLKQQQFPSRSTV